MQLTGRDDTLACLDDLLPRFLVDFRQGEVVPHHRVREAQAGLERTTNCALPGNEG